MAPPFDFAAAAENAERRGASLLTAYIWVTALPGADTPWIRDLPGADTPWIRDSVRRHVWAACEGAGITLADYYDLARALDQTVEVSR